MRTDASPVNKKAVWEKSVFQTWFRKCTRNLKLNEGCLGLCKMSVSSRTLVPSICELQCPELTEATSLLSDRSMMGSCLPFTEKSGPTLQKGPLPVCSLQWKQWLSYLAKLVNCSSAPRRCELNPFTGSAYRLWTQLSQTHPWKKKAAILKLLKTPSKLDFSLRDLFQFLVLYVCVLRTRAGWKNRGILLVWAVSGLCLKWAVYSFSPRSSHLISAITQWLLL